MSFLRHFSFFLYQYRVNLGPVGNKDARQSRSCPAAAGSGCGILYDTKE